MNLEGQISFIGFKPFSMVKALNGLGGLISNAMRKTFVLHYIGHHKFINIIHLSPIQSHPIPQHLSQEPNIQSCHTFNTINLGGSMLFFQAMSSCILLKLQVQSS